MGIFNVIIEEELGVKKPIVLCLHGYRTSGEIMSTQLKKWPAHILDRLILVFPDVPHPADGRSEVESIFPPPSSAGSTIAGRSLGLYAEEALNMFQRLKYASVEPNYVTFVGVLSACSHAGLVEQGLALFYSMKNEYGIEPGTDHYACIAMLLGRSRRLQEARIFIENMPIKPAAIVWRSLLSACRLVDNLELGIYAAEMAILSDPKDSGTYVLISNIFASKGMWSEVGKVRKGRDDNRVMKEPGHSWLEIRGNTHIFLARDQSHQESGSIYFMLDLLNLGIGREVLDLGTGSLFRYAVGCCVPS